jgi:hypothetical protein
MISGALGLVLRKMHFLSIDQVAAPQKVPRIRLGSVVVVIFVVFDRRIRQPGIKPSCPRKVVNLIQTPADGPVHTEALEPPSQGDRACHST